MSLQFYFGPSGAGKSRKLYTEIIRRAMEQPKQNFLVIVPDQFTMQTQKELVTLSERGGIMNIDVLSFGRLSHRILEEVGRRDIPVLDDTGKSLVLQKVAGDLKEQLPALGGFLHRQGYIHEVKSAISEFMQYGISPEGVEELISFSARRGALVNKLKDLHTLYEGFVKYIDGQFITTEETLDVLRRSLSKSKLLPGSVVVFDGFTGFTPIQNRVIQELMILCEEVIVSLTIGEEEDPYQLGSSQKLFYLSRKTVADLERLAKEAKVERAADVFVKGGARFGGFEALNHLERNLFRYTSAPYEESQNQIQMFEAVTVKDEVHQTGLAIRELMMKKGLAYRDIAVVAGDLESYAPYVEEEFGQIGIPCFIDRTRGIRLNPLTEYIKSALDLFLKDFSYEAVFRYLRSGMTDITADESDRLENYVIQTGIRGERRYGRLFTHKTAQMNDDEEQLQCLNATREKFMGQVEMLQGRKHAKAGEYVDALYEFLVHNEVQQKLVAYEEMFREQGDLTKEREFAQIYRLVMDLLNQIYELLGEEEISLQEFADILEAGFGEIEVGTIPQNVDRILVGDIERTRLKQVKVLFFMGVNDGNIPKNASKGGIISDIDREFLSESGLELAPTPRQQMYIQRFYLYLNMTKPSERLYLSYAKINSAGKSIRPAYLTEVIRNLFPDIKVAHPQNRGVSEQIVTPGEGMRYLAQGLREYAEGTQGEEERKDFFTVYRAYGGEELLDKRDFLESAAFRRFQEGGLSKAVAQALYGMILENSVSRLETYAACAYKHFLQYGLRLQERKEFGFETVDMGNIYHGVLEGFARKLQETGYTWFDFPKEYAGEQVKELVSSMAATYGDTILYSSARSEYAITRMSRVLTRTVLTLQNQLRKGHFRPEKYEMSFRYADKLDSIQIRLSEQEKMLLRGRIDRIDVAEQDDKLYVKVIDYKSGEHKFDIAALYYGLQLQLVVYMNAAMEYEAKEHPGKEVVPAALLYYRVEDPTVESSVELTEEELEQQILGKLRMSGVVNDDPEIVERLDAGPWDKSDVIPVERKKDGSFSARSHVMSGEGLRMISDYVNHKVATIGREILDGKVAMNPYEMGSDQACTYCAYKKVCGFDPTIPGYEKRILENLNQEEAMRRMSEEVGTNGS